MEDIINVWRESLVSIRKDILDSENPEETLRKDLLTCIYMAGFLNSILQMLKSMEAEINDNKCNGREEETVKGVRGNSKESHDEGNPRYKERGVEGNW